MEAGHADVAGPRQRDLSGAVSACPPIFLLACSCWSLLSLGPAQHTASSLCRLASTDTAWTLLKRVYITIGAPEIHCSIHDQRRRRDRTDSEQSFHLESILLEIAPEEHHVVQGLVGVQKEAAILAKLRSGTPITACRFSSRPRQRCRSSVRNTQRREPLPEMRNRKPSREGRNPVWLLPHRAGGPGSNRRFRKVPCHPRRRERLRSSFACCRIFISAYRLQRQWRKSLSRGNRHKLPR